MKLYNKNIFIITILAALFFSACSPEEKSGRLITPFVGTIEKTIESTGLIIFDDDYAVTSSVSGKVLSAAFEEGDFVLKGQSLYKLDSKEIENQISQTNISLEKANEVYRQSVNAVNDLFVKSFAKGMVTKTYCHLGDYVSPGSKIADVVDSNNLILRVPFSTYEKENIYIGRSAQIVMSMDGSVINGVVTKVFDSSQPLDGRQLGVNVEISVVNPGALKQGDAAFAKIGEAASATDGTLKNSTEQSISATQSGQVVEMKIKEGSSVNEGEIVMVIKNDALQNAVNTAAVNVKDIKNILSQQRDRLLDYDITSPIDGVIIQKSAKEEDVAAIGAPLAVVADKENLYINGEVDEMYIKDITAGQGVTAAIQGAIDGREYIGNVVSVSDSGNAKNGVTYYDVKISIEDSDGLMEAMNMDVKITVASKDNALLIPIESLKGNKVKIQKGRKIVETEVVVGIKNKQYAEILEGLSANDKIVGGETK